MAYPFTLLVMLTIAAPISFMQTRRGGVGAKVFLGILLGTGFFMINQLALNVSLLFNWPPVVTALLPNIGAMTLALTAVFMMENRNAIAQRNSGFFFWKKSPL
jgi:lipopolysaccharide export system permease protein